MNRFVLFSVCLALVFLGGAVHAKELSDTDLLEAALAEGKKAPKAGKLGTYRDTDIIVEQFGDLRIIRYDVDTAQCGDVDGVIRTVATPTGATGTLQRYCVPGVLMGEKEKPKKEMH
jgi:hypothetical protein